MSDVRFEEALRSFKIADDTREILRAAHAAEVEAAERAVMVARQDDESRAYDAGLAEGRAAGVKEGRRQMAREVFAKLPMLTEPPGMTDSQCHALRLWLASQSREEAEW